MTTQTKSKTAENTKETNERNRQQAQPEAYGPILSSAPTSTSTNKDGPSKLRKVVSFEKYLKYD